MKPKDAVVIRAYATKLGNHPCDDYQGPRRTYFVAISAISCYYMNETGQGIIELSNGRKFTGVTNSDIEKIKPFFNITY
jgi:hypothetical protein